MSLSQHFNKKERWSLEDEEALAQFNVSLKSAPRNLMHFGKKLREVIAGPELLTARKATSAILMDAKGKVMISSIM
jgi:F0F1-type ATP synthase alpha subunit